MQLLENDVVLVLGGGSGLGLGVAEHCHGEGAQVVIMEVVADKVAALQASHPHFTVVQGDVTKVEDLERCKALIVEKCGRLNALIGAQGIFDGNVPLADTPLDRVGPLFDELFHINVLGYILGARVFIDLLDASEGAIVLTASSAAFAADGGGLFYTATKGAVVSIVHQLGFEFAPRVRVNGVAPSGIANSQLRGPEALGMEGFKQSDIPKDEFLTQFRKLTLMPGLPTPVDYGPLFAFLASRHNKIMTGQIVIADQGLLNRAVLSFGS